VSTLLGCLELVYVDGHLMREFADAGCAIEGELTDGQIPSMDSCENDPSAADTAAFERSRRRWMWLAFVPVLTISSPNTALICAGRFSHPRRPVFGMLGFIDRNLALIMWAGLTASFAWIVFCSWNLVKWPPEARDRQLVWEQVSETMGTIVFLCVLNGTISVLIVLAARAVIH
jgi:hypothetical protein